jgi:hypothetical protein
MLEGQAAVAVLLGPLVIQAQLEELELLVKVMLVALAHWYGMSLTIITIGRLVAGVELAAHQHLLRQLTPGNPEIAIHGVNPMYLQTEMLVTAA